MAKRRPGSQLTQDNWNDDDEPEDSGEFRKANDNELKNRVRKVARRRMMPSTTDQPTNGDTADGSTDNVEPTKTISVFSGFSGFVKTDKPIASSPFAFLSSTNIPATTGQANENKSTSTVAAPKTISSSETKDQSSMYCAKLKGLNQDLSAWISKKINENPFCILTPIFDDYAKHLKQIQEEKSKLEKNNTKPLTEIEPAEKNKPFEISSANSGFRIPKTNTDADAKSNLDTASSFSFGSSMSSGSATGFSFSSSDKPFSFGFGTAVHSSSLSVAPQTSGTVKEKSEEDAENDDEPPKVEFTPVVEDDSLYSKRCKVYVKADSGYKERGVGMLYIKSVESGSKTQLLVRADTNLGNILLNILLTDAVPSKRIGKNDVMLICLPTPDSKPPPTTVLVRVKTAIEADDLLAQIEKYKK